MHLLVANSIINFNRRFTISDKMTKDKPREFYIPPDPTEDENEIFNTGISSGINFDKYDKIPVNVSRLFATFISTLCYESHINEHWRVMQCNS